MIERRGNFKMIWKDIDEITRALVNEDIWLAIAGNYITQNALDAGSTDIEFVNPTAHGLMGWIDGQCVIKNEQFEKNPDLVWEWMQHYHSGEQQALIIGNTWLASTSRRCLEILESQSEENKNRVEKLAAREVGIVKGDVASQADRPPRGLPGRLGGVPGGRLEESYGPIVGAYTGPRWSS